MLEQCLLQCLLAPLLDVSDEGNYIQDSSYSFGVFAQMTQQIIITLMLNADSSTLKDASSCLNGQL